MGGGGATPESAVEEEWTKNKSHVAQLNGLRDRGEAHGAHGLWALADLCGTIETEQVVAARNQGSDHLVIHTLDADLLPSPG